ncbi:hypothetical protein HELRODRAFT_162688 [Helobdella robusta]|uniref:Uncharacterized protein n=1 Tax=Helobdella robusta TaxID=6412 RepID=T1ET05_HELRO|nr:hypothetical protein HELRODRAFT_162688 [Helobdella robusta]ESN99186.1 hypothetical protein HELRODRAFT_162688 [Helobdella robusta]
MESSFSELNIIQEHEEEDFMISTMLGSADEGRLEDIEDLLMDVPNINIDIHNKHLETALHFASGAGHLDVVLFLISRGSNVNCKDKHDDTPLYWACRQGHLKVVEGLIANDADIHTRNKQLRLCLRTPNQEEQDSSAARIPIGIVIAVSYIARTNHLTGQTCLHAAVRYQRTEIIKYLCQAGADVNAQDQRGETVMHMCAWLGLPFEICEVLCSHNSMQFSTRNKNGETCMHVAAGRGSLDCLKCLLKYGADINILDKRKSTALHLSCHCQHLNIVKELLVHGSCHMDAVDQNGDAAIHIACHAAILPLVQLLSANGCNVDLINKSGLTPLHIASKQGNTEIVRCLLLAGANVDIRNKSNITAQMIALARGKNNISDLLTRITPRSSMNFETRWVLRSALNFASDGEVVREVASAGEQDMEIYEKRKGHEQLD